MHKILFLAGALAASVATAQSPITTLFASNNGGAAGGGVYFDLTVNTTVTFNQIDTNSSVTAGTAFTLNVWTRPCDSWLGNTTSSTGWTLVATGSGTTAGLDQPSVATLATPFELGPGNWAIALEHVGIGARYTNGNGSNQVYSNAELTLAAGGASNVNLSGTPFNPRVWNGSLHYTVGGTAAPLGCATVSTYGNGCYFGATSFYEQFANLAGFDLGGAAGAENVVRLTAAGPVGYAVSQGTTAWYTPAGPQVLNNSATPGAMGDDNYSQPLNLPFAFPYPTGSTNVVHACSNGYIRLGSLTLTTGDFSPTVAELLGTPSTSANNGPRLAPLWADLHAGRNTTTNPASGVYFDVDPSGNAAYVTWLDIGEFANSTAGASSLNFQVALFSNGDVEYRYGLLAPATGSSATITGASKGSANPPTPNPGNTDISMSMPFTTSGPDAIPLAQSASPRPVLGSTVSIVTSNIPATAFGTFNILSFGSLVPGVDLGSFGMPGCDQNVTLAGADTLFLVGSPSVTRSFTIPNVLAYAGANLYSQSLSLVPGVNAFGGITSNGVQLLINTN